MCKRGRDHPNPITKGPQASSATLRFVSEMSHLCLPRRNYISSTAMTPEDVATAQKSEETSSVHCGYMEGLQKYESMVNLSSNGYVTKGALKFSGSVQDAGGFQMNENNGTFWPDKVRVRFVHRKHLLRLHHMYP